MANKDQPLGLVPVRHANGAPYNGAYNEYYVPSTYATALFVGDPVVITGTGNAAAYNGNPPGALPEVNKSGEGTLLTGVIVGFNPLPDDLSKTYNPASTERIVYVADDPDLIFECQEDSDGGAIAVASIGLNCELEFATGGNTLTGKSGVELDSSGVATTNTFNIKIMRLVNRVDNDLGTNAKFEVCINLHTQRAILGV